MFALLVSSKGFCAADEEMPGAGAAAASAKPIENIETHIMYDMSDILPPGLSKQVLEEKIYNKYAKRLPVVAYTSSWILAEDIKDLKPGEEILIRNIRSSSTVDFIVKSGFFLELLLSEVNAAVFKKQ